MLLFLSVGVAVGFLAQAGRRPLEGEPEYRQALRHTRSVETAPFSGLWRDQDILGLLAAGAGTESERQALQTVRAWLRLRFDGEVAEYAAFRDVAGPRRTMERMLGGGFNLELADYAGLSAEEASRLSFEAALAEMYPCGTTDASFGAGVPESVYIMPDLGLRFAGSQTTNPAAADLLGSEDRERYVGGAHGAMFSMWTRLGRFAESHTQADGSVSAAVLPLRLRTTTGLEASILIVLIERRGGGWSIASVQRGIIVYRKDGMDGYFAFVY